MNKPDIDDLLDKVKVYKFVDGEKDEVFDLPPQAKDYIKQAIYSLLASEAVEYIDCKESPERNWQECTCPNAKAVPILVIKELLEVAEK